MGGTTARALAICALIHILGCSDPGLPSSTAGGGAASASGGRQESRPQAGKRSGLVGTWRDARPGDWVQFLNVHGNVVVMTVISVDARGVDLRMDSFTREGKPDSTDTRRVDTTEYFTPPRKTPFSPVEVGYDLPAGGRLECLQYFAMERGKGKSAETVMCPEVRAGGIVFMRKGASTYYILLDFGDAGRKPRGDWDRAVLTALRTRYEQSYGEEPELEEDPPEGEPPEPPED
jgi:hypothetical protein